MNQINCITGFYKGKAYMLLIGVRTGSKHTALAQAMGYHVWTFKGQITAVCEDVKWRIYDF